MPEFKATEANWIEGGYMRRLDDLILRGLSSLTATLQTQRTLEWEEGRRESRDLRRRRDQARRDRLREKQIIVLDGD